MATRDVFSADELAQLRGFPEVGRAELIRFFMLTPGDEEFVRRFRDMQWRIDNPHHPIAYMAWMHETNQRLREKVRQNKPLFMVRRGNRIAFIPQGCDTATRDKILALL